MPYEPLVDTTFQMKTIISSALLCIILLGCVHQFKQGQLVDKFIAHKFNQRIVKVSRVPAKVVNSSQFKGLQSGTGDWIALKLEDQKNVVIWVIKTEGTMQSLKWAVYDRDWKSLEDGRYVDLPIIEVQ
jgi:hypothetical protein